MLPLLLALGCDDAPPVVCGESAEPTAFFRDDDADGFGVSEHVRFACEAPAGFVAEEGDCHDDDATNFPGAAERCDQLDNDCNGEIDDAVAEPTVWYADADGDGFGNAASTQADCDAPLGFLADATDCDDGDAAVHPGADEWCDTVDQDCDGAADDPESVDAPLWHADADGDGFGDGFTGEAACAAPEGLIANGTDCDDTDASVHPEAEERCDATDRDCDGDATANATDGLTWYLDDDLDGYGRTKATIEACTLPDGYAELPGDCNDVAGAIHPGAPEFCDEVDHDCDGEAQEADATDALVWYLDADLDGYGDPATVTAACTLPEGYAATADDCDDADPNRFPGAPDACDGVDRDCDGTLDEDDSTDAVAWYRDVDGDGYGNAAYFETMACPGSGPARSAADACDCDDRDASYNPDGLDCDTIECVTGSEVWVDDSCGLRDAGVDFLGSASAAASVRFDEPTAVTFCDGTWYVNLATTSDLTLASVNGASVTTLDAAGGTGVAFAGDLVVEGLTVTGAGAAVAGVGSLMLLESTVSGNTAAEAVIRVEGNVTLDGSTVSDNVGERSEAGSVACELAILDATGAVSAVDSVFSDNRIECSSTGTGATTTELIGATLRVVGNLDLIDSDVTDNVATAWSVGASAVVTGAAGAWVTGDVTMADSAIAGNVATASLVCSDSSCTESARGGGLRLEGGSLLCTGAGGFWANGAIEGGGAYWASPAASATFVSSGCDWGSGSADNDPDDLAGAAVWAAGDAADFVCDAAGVCF